MIEKLKILRENARFSAEITNGETQEVYTYFDRELTRILSEGPYELGTGQDWTDTRDGQPLAFGQYIAQIRGAKVPTALYYNPGTKEWSDQNGYAHKVIAWQPFPERYERS